MIRLLPFLLAIAAISVWVYALVDAIKVPDDSMYPAGNKLIWVLVILLAGPIGAILYLTVGRPEPQRAHRPPPRPPQQPPLDDVI